MLLLSGETRGERLVEFESKSVKTRDAVDSSKLCLDFHQVMKARRTWFINFFHKIIIFRPKKQKNDFRSVNEYLISFIKL